MGTVESNKSVREMLSAAAESSQVESILEVCSAESPQQHIHIY